MSRRDQEVAQRAIADIWRVYQRDGEYRCTAVPSARERREHWGLSEEHTLGVLGLTKLLHDKERA